MKKYHKKIIQTILATGMLIFILGITEPFLIPVSAVYAQEASSSATPTQEIDPTPTPIESLTPAIFDVPADSTPSATPTPTAIPTPSPTPIPQIPLDTSPVVYEYNSPSPSDLLLPADTSSIPPSLESQQSSMAQIHAPAQVFALSKQSFGGNEPVIVDVANDTKGEGLRLELLDSDGLPVPVRMLETDTTGMTEYRLAPKDNLTPGTYTLNVYENNQVISTQNFLWGVLAMNTDKSIYTRGETAHIAIAVLNEKGDMVCDATVTLEIIDPLGSNTMRYTTDGSIRVNSVCPSKDFTLIPDYETEYVVWTKGKYTAKLNAITQNGSYSVTDSFTVEDAPLFEVSREAATRIFPPYNYPVRINITARQPFKGEVVETVPADFDISEISGVIPYATVSAVTSDPYRLISTNSGQLIHLGMPFTGSYATTLEFGENVTDPYLKAKYTAFGLIGHDGTDYALPEGTPVLAVDDGVVVRAEYEPYGYTVVVQHEWGRSYYGHFQSFSVVGNQKVSKGQPLGLSGKTGLATGPHLHFGIRLNTYDINNGYYGKIDPAPYLSSSVSPYESVSLKKIYWNLTLNKGQSVTVGYAYKAPDVSPQLYLNGPLTFTGTDATQSALPAVDLIATGRGKRQQLAWRRSGRKSVCVGDEYRR